MSNEYIDGLLIRWSEWRIKRIDGGSGYPNKAALLTIPGNGSGWISEIDSQCYEVDYAVCELESDCKDVIMKKYTQTGTKEQKAQRCGCSIRTYDARILKAFGCILNTLDKLRKQKEHMNSYNNKLLNK